MYLFLLALVFLITIDEIYQSIATLFVCSNFFVCILRDDIAP